MAALWAMSVGVLAVVALVLVGWLVDGRTGAGAAEAAQVGLQAFLLAHGGSLAVDWGTLGLVPLGLTALPAWLLMRAGAAVARRRGVKTLPQLAEAVAAITIVYAVLAVLLTTLATSAAASAAPLRAGAGAAVLAAVAGAVGVVRVSGLGQLPIVGIRGPRRAVAAAVMAGCLALAAGGALTVAIALSLDMGRYAELSRAVAPTWTGAVGLMLVALLLLPNAAVFAASAGVGPGFSLGQGTTVGAFEVHLDTVPAFPLLAALPDGGQPPFAALLIPLLAGIAIGAVLVRRLDADDERGPFTTALWAGLCGVLSGMLLGVAAYAAGGPLGSGQLATIGPSGWVVGTYAAAEFAAVAALTAGVLRWREGRAAPRPQRS
ncbi:MAG: cell division protein PerM [Geodermatophilaceae bacterium]